MPINKIFGEHRKIHFETFGCTSNVADTMRLRAVLKKNGHAIVAEDEADLVVVNTCTVAKRTELNVTKRLKELKENGKEVVVAGCMTSAQPELVKSILGNAVAMVTPQDIHNSYSEEEGLEQDFDPGCVISAIPIAIGCVGECSYCIVKRARGDLISYEPEKILERVKSALERGVREVRITSQDCSAYGWDWECEQEQENFGASRLKLPGLLDLITAIKGDFRIRVGMMNPFTIHHILDELLDAFDSDKVFKFFHVPVQSGSDKVLIDMKRNYKAADFVEIVKKIKQRFEYRTICTDFIIGFPTETVDAFSTSLNLLRLVRPEKVNITRFSPRPGTEASKLKDLLEREKKRRSRIISSLYHEIALAKNTRLVGKRLPVLITEKGKGKNKNREGGVIGRDPSYKMIVVNSELDLLPGDMYSVRITEAKSTYLVGEVIDA